MGGSLNQQLLPVQKGFVLQADVLVASYDEVFLVRPFPNLRLQLWCRHVFTVILQKQPYHFKDK